MASTGRRTVNAASVRVAGPIWTTWSSRAPAAPSGPTRPRVPSNGWSANRACTTPPRTAIRPGAGERAQVDRRERGRRRVEPAGFAREEEADEHGERLVGVGPSRSAASPSSKSEVAVVADEPVDARLVEAGALQALAEVGEHPVACR